MKTVDEIIDDLRNGRHVEYRTITDIMSPPEKHLAVLVDHAFAGEVIDCIEQLKKRMEKKGIVRCKDCVYARRQYVAGYDEDALRCDHPNLSYDVECDDHWIDVEPDDFCSYGKRRTHDTAHDGG